MSESLEKSLIAIQPNGSPAEFYVQEQFQLGSTVDHFASRNRNKHWRSNTKPRPVNNAKSIKRFHFHYTN